MPEPRDPSGFTPHRAQPYRWLAWIGLVLLAAGAFLYSSWPKKAEPAAFTWTYDLQAARAAAARENKLILIDFHTSWCTACQYMDREVFPRKEVAEALAGWIAVKIDAEKDRKLADRYQVRAYPTFVVLSPEGQVIAQASAAPPAEQFIEWLKSAAQHHRESDGPATDAGSNTLRDYLRPFAPPETEPGSAEATQKASSDPKKPAVTWVYNLNLGLARAAKSDQLVFVDFFADWCGPCRYMDRQVFPREDVARALADWVTVKINGDQQAGLADRYRVRSYPTYIALSPKGDVVARLLGGQAPETLIQWIQNVKTQWAAPRK